MQPNWCRTDGGQLVGAMPDSDTGFHVLLPGVRERAAAHLALHGGQGPLRPAKLAHAAGPHDPVTPVDQSILEHHLDGACGIVAYQRRRLSRGSRQGRDLVVGQRARVQRLQAEVVHGGVCARRRVACGFDGHRWHTLARIAGGKEQGSCKDRRKDKDRRSTIHHVRYYFFFLL